MIHHDIRAAIFTLRQQGHGTRSIARTLKVSRWAVREVLQSGSAEVPKVRRPEKASALEADIRELHQRCKGNLVRVHEELRAAGATLSYQALTGFCRRHGIGYEPPKPAGRYHFEPGEEMQHDTSPHVARIGGVERKVQTASLVLPYSRMRFIQLYPNFTRFVCKLFLHDALTFFGAAAKRCMVDNTHVIVLRGTGREMVPVPEMAAFGERYGFEFVAHEKGDANRSAHVERGFHHIENNFLAGRDFTDFAHANREAVEWCERVNAKPRRELHASARELFVKERPAMKPLPAWLPDIYVLHHRIVDIEGYVQVDGHRYSVPYQLIGRQLEVRETKAEVRFYEGSRLVAQHQRGFTFEKKRWTKAEHRPAIVRALRESSPEERELLADVEPLASYAKQVKARNTRWPAALRRLLQMSRDYPPKPFVDALQSATHYGLYDLDRLERMVLKNIATEYFVAPADRGTHRRDEDNNNEG